MVGSAVVAMTLIPLAVAGHYSSKLPSWALPTLSLSRSTASASIGVVNSIGSLGGFVSPYMISVAKGIQRRQRRCCRWPS
jgi:ACS family tartrate transporter-like MFS transporter